MEKYNHINEFYVQKGEEFLVKDVLPDFYIGKNLGSVNADFALKFLQNELNAALSSFINGGFSYKGFVLYPFVRDVSKGNLRKIKRLKDVILFLDKEGYDFSESIKKYNKNANSDNFASVLSSLYQDFSKIKFKNLASITKPECREFEIKDYKKSDLSYLSPLNELKRYANNKLRKYLSGFYLHGSLATGDYVKGWSDVDTLAVISRETVKNPDKLHELRDRMYRMRHYFYKIDPLQHHGSIIISEYDLENYCQAYFPVPIFKYAKSLLKGDKVKKFSARDFSSEALTKLFYFVNYFRRLNIERKFSMGSYDTKALLHSITLFPSVYLQAKGVLGYKKFSFDMAKKDFSKKTWEVINRVSLIRSSWKSIGSLPLISLSSSVNPLPAYQFNSRIMDLFSDVKKANNIDVRYLVGNMHKLSEEAWSRIKKNAKKRL